MTAGRRKHLGRGTGETRRLGLQSRGRKEAGRHAEPRGERVNRRLRRLEIERDHAGDRVRGVAMALQGRFRQPDQLIRGDAALAADAQREDRGVEDEPGRGPGIVPIGEAHLELPLRSERRPARPQPIGIAGFDPQTDALAPKQGAGDRLCRLGITYAPAGGRRIQGEIEAQIAGGGDRRRATERLGDRAGQPVRPPVPAEQRHDGAAVLGDDHHRRLAALVLDQRRQHPDHDPARAERNDRTPGGEQLPQPRGELVVGDDAGPASSSAQGPCSSRAPDRQGDPARRLEPAGTEHDDRWELAHESRPPGSSTKEK